MARCEACGGALARVSLTRPVDYEYGVIAQTQYRYEQCPNCGSEWMLPRPDDARIAAFYPPDYHAYCEDHGLLAGILVGLRAALRRRLYAKLFSGRDVIRLFDVGSGDCRHFRELTQTGRYVCAGVEINPQMAEAGRDAGYDIESGTLEAMDMSRHAGRYDIVTMYHVLEHVRDAGEVMRRVHALLAPGGVVIGQLPRGDSWEEKIFGGAWAGYHYPRHLQVFTRKGLSALLASVGFGAISITPAPHCQTAISIQNALLAAGLKLKLASGRSRIYSALLAASLPFELVATLFNQTGTMNFIARK